MPRMSREIAALFRHRSRMLEATIDAAMQTYCEGTKRSMHEFAADTLDALADQLMLKAPRASAELLRRLADVADCYDAEDYARRKRELGQAFVALEDAVAKPGATG